MFMIVPTRQDNDTVPTNEVPCGELRTRVRKACNRCRIKKSKCNGRIPCARCERDNVVCAANFGSKNGKDLARSYIASLEEQQLSLLETLKELYRQHPYDSTIHATMQQLQARGFDIGTVKPRTPTPQINAPNQQQNLQGKAPEPILWDNDDLAIDDLDSFLALPATPQAVSSILSNYGDANFSGIEQPWSQQSVLQDMQMSMGLDISHDMQLNTSTDGPYPANECLMDPFLTSDDFTLEPSTSHSTTT